ncbi:hypothetical protein ACQZV8_07965 [Magnetococcales bacterium HHB-1]
MAYHEGEQLDIQQLISLVASEPMLPLGTYISSTLDNGLHLGALYIQALERIEKNSLVEVFEDRQYGKPVNHEQAYVMTSLFGLAQVSIPKDHCGWIVINTPVGNID